MTLPPCTAARSATNCQIILLDVAHKKSDNALMSKFLRSAVCRRKPSLGGLFGSRDWPPYPWCDVLNARVFSVFSVLGAILALLACGCSTVGRKVEPNKLTQITIGQTTRAEVESLLGKPQYVLKDQGETTLLYSYLQIKDPVGDASLWVGAVVPAAGLIVDQAHHSHIMRESASIIIGTGGKVVEIVTRTGDEVQSSGLLVKEGNPRCDLQKFQQIKLGETTQSQVEALLGTPVSTTRLHSKGETVLGFLCDTHTPYERLAVVIGQDGLAHETRKRFRNWYALMKRKLDETKLLEIKQGQTTRDTVESLLGTPCEVGERGDGTVLNYAYIKPMQHFDIDIGRDQRVTGITRSPPRFY